MKEFHSLENILSYASEVGITDVVSRERLVSGYKRHSDDFVLNNPRGVVSEDRYDRMVNRYAFGMTFKMLQGMDSQADGSK